MTKAFILIRWLVATLVLSSISLAQNSRENLQDAIDALSSRGGTIQLEPRVYWQHEPLNLRGRTGVRIIGEGRATEIAFVVGPDWPLLIDMTGAQWCALNQLKVTSRNNMPRVGLVLARDKSGASAGRHQFDGIRWEAPVKLATIVSFGSEVNLYTHCLFMNNSPGGGNFITSRTNTFGVTSPFGEVAGGSNLCQQFLGCTWGVYSRTDTEVNIIIQDGTGWFYITGGSMSNKMLDRTQLGGGGLAGIQIGGPATGRPCEQIVISGLEAETHGTVNAIQIVGRVRGLRLQNNLLQSLESSIRITGILEDSIIEQNSLEAGMAQYEWATKGAANALVHLDGGAVRYSRIDLRSRYLGLLSRDQSIRDKGRRPLRAFDATNGELTEVDILVRKPGDCLITNGVRRNDCRVITRSAP